MITNSPANTTDQLKQDKQLQLRFGLAFSLDIRTEFLSFVGLPVGLLVGLCMSFVFSGLCVLHFIHKSMFVFDGAEE